MSRRRTGKVSQNKIIGFLFIILMIFSLIFCFNIPNKASIGDILLRMVGLRAWESDQGGLHYTFIVAFIMYIIGLLGATYFLQDTYPRFIKRLPLLSILFLLLLPSIFTYSNRAIMTLSKGINSVEYDMDKSIGQVSVGADGRLIITADLPFKNYSNKDVAFCIKLIPNQVYTESIINEDMITAIDPDTGKPMVFTLHPKAQNVIQAAFTASPKVAITDFNGTFQPVNIVVFTDQTEKKYISGSFQ